MSSSGRPHATGAGPSDRGVTGGAASCRVMLDGDIAGMARDLAAAESNLTPIAPLTERFPGLSVDDAFRIQLANEDGRVASGARVRGRKVGLTSRAMQQQLGVTEPDYGHLLDDMLFEDGSTIDAGR